MPEVSFTDYDGETRTLPGQVGDKVMQLATRNGIPGIIGECGGVLSCATCHVIVDPQQFHLLGSVTPIEDQLLDGTACDREPTSRLSCQIVLGEEPATLCVSTPEFQE